MTVLRGEKRKRPTQADVARLAVQVADATPVGQLDADPQRLVGEPAPRAGSSVEPVEQQVQRASEVQARYADRLMQMPHVVGVAVGFTSHGGVQTQSIGVIVMVDRKLPSAQLADDALIPRELDGVPVDVQETGVFSAG